MIYRPLVSLLPPSAYLEHRPVALDLSDRSLKYAVLAPAGRQFRLVRWGEVAVPLGVVTAGEIKNRDELIALFTGLRQELGIAAATASLPEEQAYLIELRLPAMRRRDLRESIELQLEEHVTLKAADVVFDYEIVEAPGPGRNFFELSVSVFPRARVLDYVAVLVGAGFDPTALEIEAQAISRAVLPRRTTKTYLVVDFGKTRTSFFVACGGVVLFTSTISKVAGEDITRAIEKALGVDYVEAERLKISEGLLQSRRREALMVAIVPLVSVLRDELMTLLNYWHNDSAHPGHRPIEEVILCGGQSTLPGLVEYLQAGIGVPVRIGNVWEQVMDVGRTVPPLTLNESQKYTTSIGLALRHFNELIS